MKTVWIQALLFSACVLKRSIFGHNITIADDCETEYQLNDDIGVPTYNVSITILQGCPPESYNIMPLRNKYRDSFSLRVEQDGNERLIYLKWDHSTCTTDYFIRVTAVFEPNYIKHDHSQQCLHVKVRSVMSKASRREVDKLHFNCLRIPSDIKGAMHIHRHYSGIKSQQCVPGLTSTFTEFNIGCTFDRTNVVLGGDCLNLRLQYLPSDFDLYRSSISIEGPDGWRATHDLNSLIYVDQTERFLFLPVNRQGKYTVKVELVCSTNGETRRRYFTLEKMVSPVCSNTMTSLLIDIEPTSPPVSYDSQKGLVILLVTLACVTGIGYGIITAGFVYKSRQREQGQQTTSTSEPLASDRLTNI